LIYGGYQIFTAFSSHNWPEVTGKVTAVEITDSNAALSYGRSYGYSTYNRREYTPVVRYVYLVDHVSHEGQANLNTFRSRSDAEAYAYSAYRKGMHLQVLYNPQHPNFSSLRRSAI
jgi:hypothetical protein